MRNGNTGRSFQKSKIRKNKSYQPSKPTVLAFAIAYAEMFTMAKQVAAQMSNILPLFVAGIFYYVFNIVVAGIMGMIEKKLDYFE